MADSDMPFGVWLVFSLVCGAICAAITAPKMRNGIGWFLLGMVFGPIAIVLAVIAPPLKDASDETSSLDETRIDVLARLAALRDRGVLTEAEFEAEKARLLATPRRGHTLNAPRRARKRLPRRMRPAS